MNLDISEKHVSSLLDMSKMFFPRSLEGKLHLKENKKQE